MTEAFDIDYPMKNSVFSSVWYVGSANGLICLATENKFPTNSEADLYGCGYDELHEDYKVDVINVICDYPQYSKIRIYSLKKDCWRTVKDYQGFLMDCSAKFVNGKLYWCSSATEKVGQYKDCNIISLDLTYEIWGKLDAMAKEIRKLTLAAIQSEPHAARDICGRRHPTHDVKPQLRK
uniref:F-box associated beta-propeller type 1 domain-containing protein n=1 Tax=Nicotiana tabacum TaxID=4097 RepID=A0A1S3X8C4_TOBAC|nr:PREDICTED: uncharacterized protein LOC107762175 [Nicotiana tabacum]